MGPGGHDRPGRWPAGRAWTGAPGRGRVWAGRGGRRQAGQAWEQRRPRSTVRRRISGTEGRTCGTRQRRADVRVTTVEVPTRVLGEKSRRPFTHSDGYGPMASVIFPRSFGPAPARGRGRDHSSWQEKPKGRPHREQFAFALLLPACHLLGRAASTPPRLPATRRPPPYAQRALSLTPRGPDGPWASRRGRRPRPVPTGVRSAPAPRGPSPPRLTPSSAFPCAATRPGRRAAPRTHPEDSP